MPPAACCYVVYNGSPCLGCSSSRMCRAQACSPLTMQQLRPARQGWTLGGAQGRHLAGGDGGTEVRKAVVS